LQNCRGKYIAFLDGDDYWTDPKKLQKQVDFLEENLDYIASFHKVKVVNKDGDTVKENKFSKTSLHDFSSEMLIKGRVIPVLAWCFRNVVKDIPPEFLHSGLGDKFLSSFLGNYGKAKFQHEVEPSAYRVGEHGMWSQKDVLSKKRLNLMTVYQLWRYYDRIGKKNIANSMFKNLCIQGYKLYPLKKLS
jgi:glycosyltransferase involved in cell wall biosynthesis